MEHESALRLGVFLGLFAVFALWESLAPRRPRSQPFAPRWRTNWALVLIDTGALRLLSLVLPLLAVGAALDAAALNIGLFNRLGWPVWLEFLLALLVLDLAIWAQHLLTHKIPLLWRFHRVHHADADMDVTTAIRFHPVEIAASMLLKIGLVYLLGPAALAVLVFEVLLNGTALFNHANIRMPAPAERLIRLLLVTPDMHRIHHSIHRAEHDSNYGFALSLWDRLFGTYTASPAQGQTAMVTGLNWQTKAPSQTDPAQPDPPQLGPSQLGWSLWLPFRS